MRKDFLSPDFWDHPPFAVNLSFASRGCVFHNYADFSSAIAKTRNSFVDPDTPINFKLKIQKSLAFDIKNCLFHSDTLVLLCEKAAKQKILLSHCDISDILKSLSPLPFILSATFHKVLTNSLCTTNRIKNVDTCSCFACGQIFPWYKDDLFHFLRCPYVCFIFQLPCSFGSLKKNYFSPANVARIAVFFEVYYLLTRQYGLHILPSQFCFVACKASLLARHVAIKNKIQYLAKIPVLHDTQISAFLHLRVHNSVCANMYGCLDVVNV